MSFLKKTTTLILIVCVSLSAKSVNWLSDLEKAKSIAKEKDRIVFVNLYNSRSRWSMLYEKRVFRDAKVIANLNDFVCVKLYPEDDTAVFDFVVKHKVNGYPALFFFDSDGELFYSLNRYLSPSDFAFILDAIKDLNSMKRYEIEYGTEHYENSEKYMYILLIKDYTLEAEKVFDTLRQKAVLSREEKARAFIAFGLKYAKEGRLSLARDSFYLVKKFYKDTKYYYEALYNHVYTLYFYGDGIKARRLSQEILRDERNMPEIWREHFEDFNKRIRSRQRR